MSNNNLCISVEEAKCLLNTINTRIEECDNEISTFNLPPTSANYNDINSAKTGLVNLRDKLESIKQKSFEEKCSIMKTYLSDFGYYMYGGQILIPLKITYNWFGFGKKPKKITAIWVGKMYALPTVMLSLHSKHIMNTDRVQAELSELLQEPVKIEYSPSGVYNDIVCWDYNG